MKLAIERLVNAIDRLQRQHRIPGVAFAVLKKFSDDRGGNLCAVIAYYGFLSIFPLLLVLSSILGFVLHNDPSAQARVLSAAERNFPSLAGYVHSGETSGSPLALVVGVLTALWSGLAVTFAAQRAMNQIWAVPRADQPRFVRSRLRGLELLALLGTALLVSTVFTGASTGGGHEVWLSVLGIALGFALNLGLYLLAFQLLVNVRLAWSAIFPGALTGALAWTVLQWLGGYYTHHVVAHASHLYGTFAVVIGILAWLFLGARVTIYCAELNVVLSAKLYPRRLRGELAAGDVAVLALNESLDAANLESAATVTPGRS